MYTKITTNLDENSVGYGIAFSLGKGSEISKNFSIIRIFFYLNKYI